MYIYVYRYMYTHHVYVRTYYMSSKPWLCIDNIILCQTAEMLLIRYVKQYFKTKTTDNKSIFGAATTIKICALIAPTGEQTYIRFTTIMT